jgi:hypothetical protein
MHPIIDDRSAYFYLSVVDRLFVDFWKLQGQNPIPSQQQTDITMNDYSPPLNLSGWRAHCHQHIDTASATELDRLALANGWRIRASGQPDDSYRQELHSLARAKNTMGLDFNFECHGYIAMFNTESRLTYPFMNGHVYYVRPAGGDGHGVNLLAVFVGNDPHNIDHWVTTPRACSFRLYLSESIAFSIGTKVREEEPETLADMVGHYAVLHGRHVAAQEELDSTTKALRDKRDASRKVMDECAAKIEKALELHGMNATIYPATKA